MTQLEKGGEVDIVKIVATMRQDRGGMVQTEQQYIFLHQVWIHWTHNACTDILRVTFDTVYGSSWFAI